MSIDELILMGFPIFAIGLLIGALLTLPLECVVTVECDEPVQVSRSFTNDPLYVVSFNNDTIAERVGLGISKDSVAYKVGLR